MELNQILQKFLRETRGKPAQTTDVLREELIDEAAELNGDLSPSINTGWNLHGISVNELETDDFKKQLRP